MIGELVLAIDAVAPRRLAAAWDNTGLLLGDPSRELRRAMLTIDLTNAVLDEAIAAKCQAIIAYHPPIFEPLKHITTTHAHEHILLRCAENKIAIVSPHTALDAVCGGMTDWLADMIDAGERVALEPTAQEAPSERKLNQARTRAPNAGKPQVHGQGRALTLTTPRATNAIVKRLQTSLRLSAGQVSFCQLNKSRRHTCVAVVPGSGASLLALALEAGCTLMVTGEAKHHDVIHAQENGCDMILLGHTNSERGFLPHFAKQLQPHVPQIRLLVSKRDRHPLQSA
ncbi:MAG: Nif3-like dinuclear metal center hexameric protein [Phycisphaerales bacterium]|nr:Nif3-like dinuclear metal center hexameric protein [Phycisphaerales bacterium]